jgi:hypothetical protein
MRRAGVLLIALSPAALAQSSASFQIESGHLNAGGRPLQSALAASANFRISLDAIGSSLPRRYRPPGEVIGLWFADDDTLIWTPERSTGAYNLYRDLVSALPLGTTGLCVQQQLHAATADDFALPGAAQAFFYLVTAENRIHEEGPKGNSSAGPRPNPTACP